MAIAPSPTAAATRLAEPLRTSPTAKMPGRLPDPGGVRGVPGADDPQPGPEPNQDRPADQVGAQDEVADALVAGDDFPEPAGRHGEDLALVHGHGGVVGALPGQQAE